MNSKPKILLVDDRIENLIALETVLQDMDVELIKVTSGNEALKQTLNHQFALALIDIQMPEMDGYELAGILREEEKTSSLPFIFISGVFTDNLNIFKGYDKGAFSFITKPFQPEILRNKVKLFIDNYQHETLLKSLNKDLEEKNSELHDLNKELEAFTYSVSHDLRAPLRVINGYSNILIEDYFENADPEAQKLLKNINANSLKMSRMIDAFLSLSKTARKELVKTRVDMDALVQSVLDELKGSMDVSNVKWKIHKLSGCYGDQQLLRQVLVNLISNAVKYSSKKQEPEVEIDSEETAKDIRYWVKDNGSGFDMKYASKLFGVFQRLHSPAEFEGTGVGLAIIQRVIARHGGSVWAEGEEGVGATFGFAIPKEAD